MRLAQGFSVYELAGLGVDRMHLHFLSLTKGAFAFSSFGLPSRALDINLPTKWRLWPPVRVEGIVT